MAMVEHQQITWGHREKSMWKSDFIFYDQGFLLIFGKKLMTFSAWCTQFIGQGRGFCSLKLCDSYVVKLTIGNSIFLGEL